MLTNTTAIFAFCLLVFQIIVIALLSHLVEEARNGRTVAVTPFALNMSYLTLGTIVVTSIISIKKLYDFYRQTDGEREFREEYKKVKNDLKREFHTGRASQIKDMFSRLKKTRAISSSSITPDNYSSSFDSI